MCVSGKLGPKRKSRNQIQGQMVLKVRIGNARIPFSVKYFLVAILFVLLM
jgi:NADH-quinone oxidoreductase subunit A